MYVLLEAREADGHDGLTTAEDGRAAGNPTVGDGREAVEDGPLVESMRDQIDHLRGQLEEAHAANRENRRIIAALTQRIPELEAPRDERGGTETVSEGKGRGVTTYHRSRKSPYSGARGFIGSSSAREVY